MRATVYDVQAEHIVTASGQGGVPGHRRHQVNDYSVKLRSYTARCTCGWQTRANDYDECGDQWLLHVDAVAGGS